MIKNLNLNQNLLKRKMILMNQALQNMQTLRILVIMLAKNNFRQKMVLKDKNQEKNKMILLRMIKNLMINKQKKKQK
jgi:hypothetical protein